MLTDLIIKNFAIIENMHATFSAGFNVLTGETGAGKSIIVDAVNLLLGGRARGEIIRTGEKEASVEAIFDLSGAPHLETKLVAAGLEDGHELLVRRIISRSGKNRIFMNGSPVSLAQLREFVSSLVNIYGQHEHQNLQRNETHLQLLDNFAGLQGPLQDYRSAFATYQQLKNDLDRLDLAERERQQRLDMLRFQQQELQGANLQPDEDEALEQERTLLLHAGKLTAATSSGYEYLYAGQDAVCERIAVVAGQLENLETIDPHLGALAKSLQTNLYSLEDIASELREYAEKLDFEPQRQQQVEDRLALLSGLKMKYAPTISALFEYLDQITAEMADLTDIEGRREQLQRQLADQNKVTLDAGQRLSLQRQKAGLKLTEKVEQELADLAMARANFEIRFFPLEEPSLDGLERGEFYLAANPGEEAQPLAKIASGGELSRIMLALKRSIPEGDGIRTLIFDEVDAGIGGEAATAVGEKISRLGKDLQVLCVTHLPQVAAFANQHYQVAKEEKHGRTTTGLMLLTPEARVAEMARMLSGSQVSAQTLVHARELIESSLALVAD
ncbi:DNA replication and repair protein RecN [Desulfuromusa kysingii]|uniref:DNA repair protein RecN n=1 Tax=Desulfuromusa kysingii TaxID=37625 RepID=A0A1H4C3Y3_9BACT|nr:DNA repair protein RecN [Desulfuromusa kysingii]SEA55060.1 DNA replication and repair protein RecN [Desulfuromusa kysingii]